MESNKNNRFNSIINSGSSAPANSRWNPTKEQIRMLENLYRLGIQTPNADQIQQITSRLRAFGQIEGKNVFYWFQNHKARQKQKQKQECLAHFHRFLRNRAASLHHHHHQSPAVVPPPCPNVVRSPYYLPQSDLGVCPQYPKLILPMGGFRRTSRSEKIDSPKASACAGYEPALQKENNYSINYKSKQETLPLFPLHPTGILQGREKPTHSLG